ncbi:MAG: hypothetical protein QG635_1382 [Bacteroidota bacterium]|nr:hypothetical protein [Bacteroidota bacterium]
MWEINDFVSNWEKGKRPNNGCEDICSNKGISINIYNEESKQIVKKKFYNMYVNAPQYKPIYCSFKFKSEAGKVKSTPNKNDKYHYTFYKSDEFEIKKIDILETLNLIKNV